MLSFLKTTDSALDDMPSEYLLYIDNIPQFYVESYEAALEELKLTTASLQLQYNDYSTFILPLKDELHVIGKYSNFVNSYDRVLHTVHIGETFKLF